MYRSMKPAVFVLTSAVVLVVLIASGYGRMQDGKLPKMDIRETSVDLGEFYEGEDIEHTFIVRNSGEADLEIKVRPG
jgi:hypothetical protein